MSASRDYVESDSLDLDHLLHSRGMIERISVPPRRGRPVFNGIASRLGRHADPAQIAPSTLAIPSFPTLR